MTAHQHQAFADSQTPLIFDESFGLLDSVEPRFSDESTDGLLAKSASYLSMMSGYEKGQQGDVLDYGTPGALHDPNPFGPYAQPPYASQLLYSPSMGNTAQDADHLQYATSHEFAAHNQMDESGPVVLDQRFRQFPQIIQCSPLQGLEGSTVSVHLQSPHELRASPRITFSLLFGSKRVACALQFVRDHNGLSKQYAVSAEVPLFSFTGWPALEVPLRMMMESNEANLPPLAVEVGTFSYTGHLIRKRRVSSDSEDVGRRPVKKSSAQLLQNDRPSDSGKYNTSPYSPFIKTSAAPPLEQPEKAQESSPRFSGHKCSASVASASSVKAHSPHTPPSWSPTFTPVNSVPKSSATLAQASSVEASAGKTPALIRTSTIQQASTSMSSAAAPHSFNPYAMYPSKAVLKLNGDLDSMVKHWSLEEWDAKRRLVQFSRRQNGSTIHADFKPIAPEDRQPNSICISCIWWEEKKDCYVTSVDTIFLLESLVAVRFTVEEKNRIRRNLEGFRPLTVSKSKADSEEFFKIIMGFPCPKPRNIEKDVKVFPWTILAHALKKIIGKYSASYSSTAGALPTPIGSHYTSNGASDSGNDMRASTSPQLNNINPGASPYSISTASFSPHMSQSRVPVTSGPPTDLRLQVPAMVPGGVYHGAHQHQTVPRYSQALRRSPPRMTAGASAGRITGSWDGSDYTTFEHGNQDPSAYNYNNIAGSMPSSQGYMSATSYRISQAGI